MIMLWDWGDQPKPQRRVVLAHCGQCGFKVGVVAAQDRLLVRPGPGSGDKVCGNVYVGLLFREIDDLGALHVLMTGQGLGETTYRVARYDAALNDFDADGMQRTQRLQIAALPSR